MPLVKLSDIGIIDLAQRIDSTAKLQEHLDNGKHIDFRGETITLLGGSNFIINNDVSYIELFLTNTSMIAEHLQYNSDSKKSGLVNNCVTSDNPKMLEYLLDVCRNNKFNVKYNRLLTRAVYDKSLNCILYLVKKVKKEQLDEAIIKGILDWNTTVEKENKVSSKFDEFLKIIANLQHNGFIKDVKFIISQLMLYSVRALNYKNLTILQQELKTRYDLNVSPDANACDLKGRNAAILFAKVIMKDRCELNNCVKFEKRVRIIKEYLQGLKVDFNHVDNKGNGILIRCIDNDNLSFLADFVNKYKCNVNITDNNGANLLQQLFLSMIKEDEYVDCLHNMIQQLLMLGFDVTKKYNGKNTLQMAELAGLESDEMNLLETAYLQAISSDEKKLYLEQKRQQQELATVNSITQKLSKLELEVDLLRFQVRQNISTNNSKHELQQESIGNINEKVKLITSQFDAAKNDIDYLKSRNNNNQGDIKDCQTRVGELESKQWWRWW